MKIIIKYLNLIIIVISLENFLANLPKILAIINGIGKKFFTKNDIPCTYIIIENEQGFEWYVEALDIIVEMCELVLEHNDPENCVLYWSSL